MLYVLGILLWTKGKMLNNKGKVSTLDGKTVLGEETSETIKSNAFDSLIYKQLHPER